MSWQPQPQPQPPAGQWPTAQAPYPAAPSGQIPPQYPVASPGRRPGFVRWIAGALVLALLLAGGVVLHRTVLSRFFGGASSPEAAVNQAIAALEKGDARGLALMLPPDEVAGFDDLQKQSKRISSALGVDADLTGLNPTEAFHVSVENLQLSTHDEQSGLTKVSIENADIKASIDTSKLSPAMKRNLGTDGAGAKDATVTIRGANVTANGRSKTLHIGGHTQPPFLMTVERDGSWYVSPFFTMFQYGSEQGGYKTSPARSVPGFQSPVAAAEGYLSALATMVQTRDISALGDASGGFEGRLFQTYREMFNAGLSDSVNSGFESIALTDSKFTLLSVDGSTARVRPDRIVVTATRRGKTGRFELSDGCLTVEVAGSDDRYCLSDPKASLFKPLIERLTYFVAVRADGGWKLSATRTIVSWFTDVLSWVGDAELPILKALMHGNPAEFVNSAKIAATVAVDGTGTVSIAPIGPYLDGGYAVVDVPNPDGDYFMVSCRGKSNECEVVTVISPSGEAQSRIAGGDRGDYKAVVFAPTGDVNISVESY